MELLPPPLPPVTLSTALALLERDSARKVESGARSPKTLAMHQAHGRWLLRELGDCDLRAVDEPFLEDALERIQGRAGARGWRLKPGTIAKRFSTLRRAFSVAVRRRLLDRVPLFPEFASAPVRPAVNVFAAYEDFADVLAELPQHRRDWFALAFWTGQHASDVERMTWADVGELDTDTPSVVIRNTKNRKPWGVRVICPMPLAEELRAMRIRATAKQGREPSMGDRLVKPWPNRFYMLGRACIRAGRPPMRATDLRHAATSVVVRSGITREAQEWFGWSDFTMMCKVYAHSLPPLLEQPARALEMWRDGKR